VLYALVKDQADQRGITDEDFGRALNEESLAAGFDAMLDGIVDFFQQTRRDLYRKVLSKGRAAMKKRQEQAAAALASPELDEMLEKAIEKQLASLAPVSATAASNGATCLPESSASSPPERPCGS
jgi:hypothetical protein